MTQDNLLSSLCLSTRYTIIHANIHSKVFKSGYVLNCSSTTLLHKEFAQQQN